MFKNIFILCSKIIFCVFIYFHSLGIIMLNYSDSCLVVVAGNQLFLFIYLCQDCSGSTPGTR